MAGTFAPEHYKETLIFLATAGVVVPLFRRLKVSPILGYLAAGAVLGPFGLGQVAKTLTWLKPFTFDKIEDIEPIAEFGVVFLLFVIGLELSFERIARMKRLVFGLGALQVFGCTAVLALGAFAMGQHTVAAIILGSALALSSTALTIPVLAEHKRLQKAAGRTAFSVLLFQDLMVAPLLFTVSMFGTSTGSSLGLGLLSTLVPAAAALAVIVLAGRVVLRPLFRLVAQAGSTELFVAATLLVVISTGFVTAYAGLSMSLGAFIAGLLLAETEYRREIEVTIEPFQGLLLGLFFVSIGAGLDLGRVWAQPLLTIGVTIAFLVLKVLTIVTAARSMRIPLSVARETALALAPGGEFAFVVIAAALAVKVVPADAAGVAMIAVTLSMFLIPALVALGARMAPKLSEQDKAAIAELAPPMDDGAAKVIIIGYGRVGRLVGSMLQVHNIPFIGVDGDIKNVRLGRERGASVYFGNATRPEFLERCGLAKASALVLTMHSTKAVEEVLTIARAARPDLTIVARARDSSHATLLYKLGVTDAIPETIEASLQLSEAVLVDIGVPMGYVIASIHEKRDEFRKLLQPPEGEYSERRAIKLSKRVKAAAAQKKSPPPEAV